MDYTDAQRAAIGTLDEPLLIVACAGSGKTQVISQRIVEILKRPGVEPKNIVAFTFTEKAAAELKERVRTLVTAELGDVTGMAEMFIGTMHGYARDLLQSWVADAFKRNVLSDIQTRLFIDRNSRASGLTVTDAWVNGTPKKLRRYVNSPLWMQVLGILREDDVDETLLPDELKASRDGYRRLLSAQNYFDFTELLRVAVDLLGEDADDEIAGALIRHVRDHVRYVVVDEYQDTNPIQEKLIERLCRYGANLCDRAPVPVRIPDRLLGDHVEHVQPALPRRREPVPPHSGDKHRGPLHPLGLVHGCGLSQAEVVRAAESAAKRAILDGSTSVSTAALVTSLDERCSARRA